MKRPSLPLFRSEAVHAQRPQTYGRVILIRPISFSILTAAAVAVGSAIVGFFIWGSYTQHATLGGQLMPDRGVIKVHSPQFGTILEKRVSEGDMVARDEVLYVISSERFSSTLGGTMSLIGGELELEAQSLRSQIERTRLQETTERESLDRMVSALELEAANLGAMIESQRERVALASDTLDRYATMHEDGFVPEEHVIAQRDTYLEQQSGLQGLERERSAVASRLTELRNQALNLPFRYESQLAELERGIASIRRELTENEAQRVVLVRAPAGGVVTAVIGKAGQFVDSGRPLLSIVPKDSVLEANLYAPSGAVGFIEVGDRVLLRYEAYPYQRFGHYEGTVQSVSRTAVSAAELIGSTSASGDAGGSEPLYKVNVALGSQTITAYGKTHDLQAGMTVQADVLQDTRRLYEWVLEPLYTLTGRAH